MTTGIQTISRPQSCRVFWSLAIALILLPLVVPQMVSGAETTGSDKVASQDQEKKKVFEYVLENRKDPFVPFLTKKARTRTINLDEIVDTNETLTGMQLFEPGQLTLVALMKRGGQDIAMVEDVTGKGYIITVGTKIGRRGVVKDILSNKVVIEQTARTRAGKLIVSNTFMVLKKEGEE